MGQRAISEYSTYHAVCWVIEIFKVGSQIEEVMKCIPDSIKILSPQLHLSRTPFSQGNMHVFATSQ